jgi:hypothetical protein
MSRQRCERRGAKNEWLFDEERIKTVQFGQFLTDHGYPLPFLENAIIPGALFLFPLILSLRLKTLLSQTEPRNFYRKSEINRIFCAIDRNYTFTLAKP